jgi:hypothetical protein
MRLNLYSMAVLDSILCAHVSCDHSHLSGFCFSLGIVRTMMTVELVRLHNCCSLPPAYQSVETRVRLHPTTIQHTDLPFLNPSLQECSGSKKSLGGGGGGVLVAPQDQKQKEAKSYHQQLLLIMFNLSSFFFAFFFVWF